MDMIFLLARILFSAVFIQNGFRHLTKTEPIRQYARSKGIPFPTVAVVASGLMLLLGGLSVLFGVYMKIGTLFLVLFLIPAALLVHNYWTIRDPTSREMEKTQFLKDAALAGAAFLIWYMEEETGPLPFALTDWIVLPGA